MAIRKSLPHLRRGTLMEIMGLSPMNGRSRTAGWVTASPALVPVLAGGFLLAALAIPSRTEGGDTRWKMQSAFESWDWDRIDTTAAQVTEWTTRLGLAHALHPGLVVELAAGWARAEETRSASPEPDRSVSVGGLLDLGASLAYRIGDRWLFRVRLNGPTGITGFPAEEVPLAQALGSRILSFSGYRLGEGFGTDAGVSHAFRLGQAALGLGLGYAFEGEYELLADGTKYDPGNRFSLAAGIDLGAHRSSPWLWRSNLRAIFYSSDARDGGEAYEAGDRYEIQSILRRRWTMTSAWTSAAHIGYGRARVPGEGGLVDETDASRGSELYLDLGLRHNLSPRFWANLGVGARIHSASEQRTGKARRQDILAGFHWLAAPGVGIEMDGRYSTGRLHQRVHELQNRDGSDLSGFRIGLAAVLDF